MNDKAPPCKVFATERVTRRASLDVCIGQGNPLPARRAEHDTRSLRLMGLGAGRVAFAL